MSKERDALKKAIGIINFTHPNTWHEFISEVQELLGEKAGDPTRFPQYKVAKDAGLDVVLFKPFKDKRIGFPLFLIQCASGANWVKKRGQPNINEWKTFIDFAAVPKKALAIPFALPEHDFWWTCRSMDGMLIDRVRLLSAGRRNANWISQPVRRQVISWMAPRVHTLPAY